MLIRRGDSLLFRESCLKDRFLTPVLGATGWDPHTLDAVCAYVGLLHAESEAALEFVVKNTLDHSVDVSKRYETHRVLTNALIYYKRHLQSRIPELDLIPRRRFLQENPEVAVTLWKDHAGGHYDRLIKNNHGAGIKYVEKLLHPLGVVVDRERFTTLERNCGLVEIADVATIGSTTLQEFVGLRGVAMHADLAAVATRLAASNPVEIGRRGRAAAEFTARLAATIARSAW
ncbi:hypothetical protein [Streptomyces sp. 184]|uniref:hypothetical protein n=1 Tax=Streptomyces sp. 184 TaxID=1827526 RepID=UPI0038923875